MIGIKPNPQSKNFDKQSRFRRIFILSLAFECILIGILIWGRFTSNGAAPRPLSPEEAGYYQKYLLSLPNVEGRGPSAAEVLAHCTVQNQKIIGDAEYTLYTSDRLPQYIYKCDTIREIMKTSEDIVYITYTSQDAEQVILTFGNDGMMRADIYAEKTDTYYVLSELENYKYLHFRHQHPAGPVSDRTLNMEGGD